MIINYEDEFFRVGQGWTRILSNQFDGGIKTCLCGVSPCEKEKKLLDPNFNGEKGKNISRLPASSMEAWLPHQNDEEIK